MERLPDFLSINTDTRPEISPNHSPPGKFDAVYQASFKGPLPTDPEVREATARLIRYRVQRLDRTRWLNFPVFGLLSLLGIYLALTSTRLWWLAVAAFVLQIPIIYRRAHRLQRRAELFGIAPTTLA
jgi:hypothetical protein